MNSAHIVGLAVKGLTSESLGMTTISVKFNGTVYDNVHVIILKDLLTDVNSRPRLYAAAQISTFILADRGQRCILGLWKLPL